MIDPRPANDGFPHYAAILPVDDDGGFTADAARTYRLEVVAALLSAGMPVSAMLAAERYEVQFRPKTLRRWARGDIRGDDRRARATYAFLHLGEYVG